MKNTEEVAIFWDYENCNTPTNASGYLLVSNIAALVRRYGIIKQFRAYLEIAEPSAPSRWTTLRSELQSSGVSLVDCPHNGRKDVADKMLLVDMMTYAIDNPAPSTIVVITGDRDFTYALATLKLRGYRIVLITLPHAPTSLKCQASVCFDWFEEVVNSASGATTSSSNRYQRRQSSECMLTNTKHSSLATASRKPEVSNPFEEAQAELAYDIDINQYLHKGPDVSLLPWAADVPKVEGKRDAETVVAPCREKPVLVSNNLEILPSEQASTDFTGDAQISLDSKNPVFSCQRGIRLQAAQCARLPTTESPLELSMPLPASFKSSPSTTISNLESTDSGYISESVVAEWTLGAVNSLPSCGHTTLPSGPLSEIPTADTVPRSDFSKVNIRASIGSRTPRYTDPAFVPLVKSLSAHRYNGQHKPLRSVIGLELAKQKGIYGKAGVTTFKEYVALAEKEGLIGLGGRDGYAWITLAN